MNYILYNNINIL